MKCFGKFFQKCSNLIASVNDTTTAQIEQGVTARENFVGEYPTSQSDEMFSNIKGPGFIAYLVVRHSLLQN